MICKRCGNENPDGVAFCVVCGEQTQWSPNATQEPVTRQQMPVQQPQQMPVQPPEPVYAPTPDPVHIPTPTPAPPSPSGDGKKPKKTIFIIIAIIVAVALAVGGGYVAFNIFNQNDTEKTADADTDEAQVQGDADKEIPKDGIEATIEKYEECLSNADYVLFDELLYPKSYIDDAIIDGIYDGDEEEYEEARERNAEILTNHYEENDIEIISVKKAGEAKNLTTSNIYAEGYDDESELIEALEDKIDVDVDEIKKCKVEITAEVNGKEDIEESDFIFYKAEDEWYIFSEGDFSAFSDF